MLYLMYCIMRSRVGFITQEIQVELAVKKTKKQLRYVLSSITYS